MCSDPLLINAKSKTGKKSPNPLKVDPTRTIGLRKAFEAELRKRFSRLWREIETLVVTEDAFGLKPRNVFINSMGFEGAWFVGNTRWAFRTDAQKVEAFGQWLEQRYQETIIGPPVQGVNWWQKYIEEGYRKGAGRAFDDVKKPALSTSKDGVSDFFKGTKEEFLRQSFANPTSREKIELIAGRVYTDLKNVNSAMATGMQRSLADGLVQGKGPREIARDLNKSVEGIGKNRSTMIARSEIVHAHAEGQLDSFEALGVSEIGVLAEWSTAGDTRVCPLCGALEGVTLTIKEARGILPRHPNCRCSWIPAGVGEDKKGQLSTKAQIEKAFDDSIKAERRKGTLEEKKAKTTWPGADKNIKEKRPESILDKKPEPKPKPAPKPKPVKAEKPKPTPTPEAPKGLKVPTVERAQKGGDSWKKEQRKIDRAKGYKDKLKEFKTGDVALAELKKIQPIADKLDEVAATLQKLNLDHRVLIRKIDEAEDQLLTGSISSGRTIAGQRKLVAELREERQNISSEISRLYSERDKLTLQKKKLEMEVIRPDVSRQITWVKKESMPAYLESKLEEGREWLSSVMRKDDIHTGYEETLGYNVKMTPDRSFYRNSERSINISPNADTSTIIHELGHRFEDETRIRREKTIFKATKEFMEERTKADVAKNGIQRMKDLYPSRGFGADEVTRGDDEFAKAFALYTPAPEVTSSAYYAGKVYEHSSTEIVSMGLEVMYANPTKFAEVDPEYFKLIYGILQGAF